jgi:hypothetical protein
MLLKILNKTSILIVLAKEVLQKCDTFFCLYQKKYYLCPMKKLVIISLILSLITTGILFWWDMIEITPKNWGALPVFYIALTIGYWFFGGIIGILTGLFDPIPDEEVKEPKEWKHRSYPTFYQSDSEDKKKDDDSGNFVTSAAIGYITDNPLIGGAIGGSMSGGILGSSLDGDLFN